MRSARLLALVVLAAACAAERDLPPEPVRFEALPATALPLPDALGVPVDAQPSISLSTAPDLVSAARALTLTSGSQDVAGTVFVEGTNTLVFAPEKPLEPSTSYTVTLAATVRGPQDELLPAGLTWHFTTAAALPNPPPPPLSLLSVSPKDGEDEVPLRAKMTFVFSRRMDPTAVLTAVRLQKLTGRAVDTAPPELGDDGRTVTLVPSGPLGASTTYVLRVTSDAAAADGTRLGVERRTTFKTTDDPTHGEPLTVTATAPIDRATEVPLKSKVRVTFSRPPLAGTVSGTTFRLAAQAAGTAVPASPSVEADGKTVALLPSTPLAPATVYELVVSGVKSDEGLPLDPLEVHLTFTTSSDPERGEHPHVVSVTPEDGAVDVPVTTSVHLTFSRPMEDISTAVGKPTLRVNGGFFASTPRQPAGSDRTELVLETFDPLPPDAEVTVVAPATFKDAVEQLSLVPFTSTFHTLADHVPPTVIATSPVDGAVDVETNTIVTFTVSEDVRTNPDPKIVLTGPAGDVAGQPSWDPVTRTATFVPALELDSQTAFTATLTQVKDIAGNALAGPGSVSFVTGGAPDTTPPAFAGVTSASATDETHVHLAWTAGLDGRSAHLKYLVWATEGVVVDFGAPASFTTSQDVTGFDVPNLAAGRTYAFGVRAMDAAHNVDANTVVRTATTPDLTAPSFAGITSLQAIPGQAALTVGWGAASDNVSDPSAIAYRVYLAETTGAEVFTAQGRAAESAPGATTLTLTEVRPGVPLVDGRTYFAVVRAVDAAGNESGNRTERSVAVADVHPPTFTGNVTATPTSSTAIRVSWDAATDNVDTASALVYRVSKKRQDEAQFQSPEADFASGLFLNVTGLTADTTYVFKVECRDRAGNVATNPKNPSSMGLDLAAPLFPNFDPAITVASTAGSGKATLTWSAAVDNRTAAGAIVYLVYSSQNANALYQATPQVVTGATTVEVTGLKTATYFFGVRAKDQAGNTDGNTALKGAAIVGPPPTYDADIAPLMSQAGCFGCHGGEFDYANLVNPAVQYCGSSRLIVPGNTSASLVYQKVLPNPPCGGQMPQGGSLSSGQVNLVRDWILAGAPQN